jgi:pimeloyl-ACP methyl ester carboxylesterase
VFIFNGGLFTDGHSHPWFTTPLLRQPGGGMAPWFAKRSFFIFKQLAAIMWSNGYRVQDSEVRHLFEALNRHDGVSYLSRAAGFVAEHKAQRDRLDFGQLYAAYRDQFPFLVGGSTEDPFEPRQVNLAEERLGKIGLQIKRLPGGHLTTNEQPAGLAQLIADFEGQVQKHA